MRGTDVVILSLGILAVTVITLALALVIDGRTPKPGVTILAVPSVSVLA
jgi:hypothetical protein